MEPNALRLAVVHNYPLVRAGLRSLVDGQGVGRVVLEVDHGLDYERQLPEVGLVHLAVVGLFVPQRDGFETIAWIGRHHKRTLCIALTPDTTPEVVRRALHAGARAVLCNTCTTTELQQAVEQVRAHGFYYNTLVDRMLRRSVEDEELERPGAAAVADLTPRERQFLVLYTRSPYPGVIATGEAMGLTPNSAEGLRKAVVARTKCRTREEMVDFVREHGIK